MQVLSQCLTTVLLKCLDFHSISLFMQKRTLTTQMKATGEVMSIGTNFEGALMKAIRSLEQHVDSLLFGDYDKIKQTTSYLKRT